MEATVAGGSLEEVGAWPTLLGQRPVKQDRTSYLEQQWNANLGSKRKDLGVGEQKELLKRETCLH